jgi:DNA-binding transcriptional MerR regulator
MGLWRWGIDSRTFHCHNTPMPDDERYSLTELADLGGVTPRTVRYYLGQGLLPSVGPSGPGSKYDTTHLARLRLIRRLQAEHLPLAEIRRRLDGLDDTEIRELAGSVEPAPPTGSALDYLRTVLGQPGLDRASASPSADPSIAFHRGLPAVPAARSLLRRASVDAPAVAVSVTEKDGEPASAPIERSQWERIILAPDVELHIRRPLARAQQKGVDRLVTIARELLEEDRP